MRVNLRVMAVKEYSTLLRPGKDAVGIFYSSSQLVFNYQAPVLKHYGLPRSANSWPCSMVGLTTMLKYSQWILLFQQTGQMQIDKNNRIVNSIVQLIIFTSKTLMQIKYYIRGSLNKFPDFFRMGIFIDSTHMKL